LTQRERNILRARIPEEYIKTRPGGGGNQLSYVEVAFVANRLDEAFRSWDFNCEVVSHGETKKGDPEIVVKGTLSVQCEDNNWTTKEQYGSCVANRGMDIGDAYKGAGSDALKKCATLLGVALELYGEEYYIPPTLDASIRTIVQNYATKTGKDPKDVVKAFNDATGISIVAATLDQVNAFVDSQSEVETE
jgi:hypothetical protein